MAADLLIVLISLLASEGGQMALKKLLKERGIDAKALADLAAKVKSQEIKPSKGAGRP